MVDVSANLFFDSNASFFLFLLKYVEIDSPTKLVEFMRNMLTAKFSFLGSCQWDIDLTMKNRASTLLHNQFVIFYSAKVTQERAEKP